MMQMQQWMQGMVLQRGIHDPGDPVGQLRVIDVVNSSQRLSAVRHLDIYKGSYIARLRECMRNQFSALAYALGRELFEAFADQYLETCPSQSYTLNELGRKFSGFLEDTRPDAGLEQKESWPDFMIELAGFEYSLSLIFDELSAENPDIAVEETPDEALRLSPVFHLFHHHYPVCRYYLEFSQKKEPELPFPVESWCVVTRLNYRLGLFVIKPAQFFFLSCLAGGGPVSLAKEELARKFHFSAVDVDEMWQEWRKNFIASGFFVKG